MKIDRIKISMEFNVMGNGLWLTGECPVAPDEDIVEEFKKGRDLLVQSFKAMNDGSYRIGELPPVSSDDQKILDEIINKEFVSVKKWVSKAKTKDEAMEIINASGFKFNIELREIAFSKQNQSNNGKENKKQK